MLRAVPSGEFGDLAVAGGREICSNLPVVILYKTDVKKRSGEWRQNLQIQNRATVPLKEHCRMYQDMFSHSKYIIFKHFGISV